jgi:hypothetical protein
MGCLEELRDLTIRDILLLNDQWRLKVIGIGDLLPNPEIQDKVTLQTREALP